MSFIAVLGPLAMRAFCCSFPKLMGSWEEGGMMQASHRGGYTQRCILTGQGRTNRQVNAACRGSYPEEAKEMYVPFLSVPFHRVHWFWTECGTRPQPSTTSPAIVKSQPEWRASSNFLSASLESWGRVGASKNCLFYGPAGILEKEENDFSCGIQFYPLIHSTFIEVLLCANRCAKCKWSKYT